MRDDHGVDSLGDQRFANTQSRSYGIRIHTDDFVIKCHSLVYVMKIEVQILFRRNAIRILSWWIWRIQKCCTIGIVQGRMDRAKLTSIVSSKWALLSLFESTPPMLYDVGLLRVIAVAIIHPSRIRRPQRKNVLQLDRVIALVKFSNLYKKTSSSVYSAKLFVCYLSCIFFQIIYWKNIYDHQQYRFGFIVKQGALYLRDGDFVPSTLSIQEVR